jgi:Ribbon-helix-helix domain
MQSTVVKRSVVVGKHKTSISLEDAFWTSLKEIAASRHLPCSDLLAPIKPYNELLGRIFPGYSFVDVDETHLSMRIKLPTGNTIEFHDLSSGEKEVFFILALFV